MSLPIFRSAEQGNFYRIVQAHMARRDGPLLIEGGTGIGKTRAYLAAVVAAAAQGCKVALVLPTHQLIDQLLSSDDLDATRADVTVGPFRPARMFDSRSDYEANKHAAMDAQLMLCTAASVIIDQRLGGEYNGASMRGYTVFDEADQLPDMAALQSDLSVTAQDLSELGVPLTTARDSLCAVLALKPRIVEPEVRAAARLILEAIDEPAWYQSAGISDGDIVLTHRLPGRLLAKVSNRSNVAFVSATLTIGGKFDDFRHAMGIAAASQLSSVVEPQDHGRLDFHTQPLEVDTPQWLDAVAKTVLSAPQPALVATTAHDLSTLLGERVPGAIVRSADETVANAAARCTGILIAAGAWAGLDTRLRWRSIIVPRIPFGQPVVIDGQTATRYLEARNTAIRRLRQVIGRGLRAPDAVCSVYILDQRVEKLSGFVPQRFADDWAQRSFQEGARGEVILSKSERDPAARRHALKHYGRQCRACGLKPLVDQQLEVHHLTPIAEGQRKTRLDDLTVLCANCHRLAHSEQPPIPLVRLRALAELQAGRAVQPAASTKRLSSNHSG